MSRREPQNAEAADASALYEALAERLDGFVEAWRECDAPDLRDYIPDAESGAVRRITLIELIKIDLEQRSKQGSQRLLEDYLNEFPELVEDGSPPLDLIYEDCHIRRRAGESVEAAEYVAKFPEQASALERLLDVRVPFRTSSTFGRAAINVEVGDEVDDFHLVSQLGVGGFAKVFLAQQKSMQRLVALKISASSSDEPQALARLDHPHIVRVFDQRMLPERRWLLLYMQYVPGGTLADLIEQIHRQKTFERTGTGIIETVDRSLEAHGQSPPVGSFLRRSLAKKDWVGAVCWIGARVAGALDYAHRKNVLHRDIKPANVLLTAEASPQLADFNISFSNEVEGATPRAYFGGSLAYMSPEQLEAYSPQHPRHAETLDARSDIYSLGILLWELLCGDRPFRDDTNEQSFTQALDEMIERRRAGVQEEKVRGLPDGCSSELEHILLSCLEPDPDDRIAGGEQLARRLEFQVHPELQKLLSPAPGSWRSWVTRFPLIALAVVALVPLIPLGVLNLVYNIPEIISRLTATQQAAYYPWVIPINAIAYGTTLLACLVYTWPVFRGLNRHRAGAQLSGQDAYRLGARTLRLGNFMAAAVFLGWLGTGLAFPVAADLGTPGGLDRSVYAHFIISQALHGLIHGGLVFYLATYLSVRAMYPCFVLETAAEEREGAEAELLRAGWRLNWYAAVLGMAPMLAVLALATTASARGYFVILAIMGLLSFLLTLSLNPIIQRDIDQLRLAVQPTDELLNVRSG